jgi:hypothetical protein
MKAKQVALIVTVLFVGMASSGVTAKPETLGVTSIDTGYTISKVRTARRAGGSYIVASSYEGAVMGIGYDGTTFWKNDLSGFMNHDLWCDDVTGDGSDEVLAANADGSVYCLNGNGELLWKFRPNDAPMYAVCGVAHEGTPYVVCGGFDKSIYYLSSRGQMVKEVPSSGYSVAKPWGNIPGKPRPPAGLHAANFLRKVERPDGSEILAVHGSMNGMQDRGVATCPKLRTWTGLPSRMNATGTGGISEKSTS